MRQRNNGFYDGSILRVSDSIGHEGTVNFQTLDGEAPQLCQIRVARAEIINGESNTQITKLIKGIKSAIGI